MMLLNRFAAVALALAFVAPLHAAMPAHGSSPHPTP